MRIFLDTANLEEIRHGVRLGVVSGVTTNPTLLAKEPGATFKETIQEICAVVEGPVSAEAVSQQAEDLIQEAREIASWAPNVVVKVPCTAPGLEAMAALSKEGIKVNTTLCFSVNQALLAAQAGAYIVSPFVGRLDDVGHQGMEVVADIVQVFRTYQIPTLVMAASLRHPLHCIAAAKIGADIATMPFKVLLQMIEHPLTEKGIARFLEDWKLIQERHPSLLKVRSVAG